MSKRITTEEFIERARKVHGDKYDYSKVEYVDRNMNICIICPTHGEFFQTPGNHLQGKGCKKCAKEQLSKKFVKTTEQFINDAKQVHGDKYNYSKTEYKGANIKVCIICPKHGEFWQTPHSHLNGNGCPKCIGRNKTIEEFIDEARKFHGDKYDYSKVEYNGTNSKVCIICPKHGEFWQTPHNHLKNHGCQLCYDEIRGLGTRKTTEEFIEQAKQIHGNKYDYSKVEYIDVKTKVCIICPKHGEFCQTPDMHLQGNGCKKCGTDRMAEANSLTYDEVIKRCKQKHGVKYTYLSEIDSNFEKCNIKMKIICPIHGEFWQTPSKHIKGEGCPKCNASHLENEIRNILNENVIEYNEQQTFDWLVSEAKLRLDFFIPSKNIAIECQGEQHFQPIDYFGGEKKHEVTKKRDSMKRKLCEEHGIKIIYYSNLGIDYPYEVIEDKNEIIKQIL